MDQPSQEFQGKDFTFTVERRPECTVAFHVHASPKLAKECYQQAIKAVSKHVSFPGFRKGKVPQEVVVKNHSKAIDDEWKQTLANVLFPEAEKVAHIPVLKKDAKITFDVKQYSLEQGADLLFTFETEPTVPHVDPKKLHLTPVKRPPVTEKEINETIRQIKFYFAEWETITDRPVQEGDLVILNVDVIDPPTNLFANTRFEVTPHSMAKWMRDLVIGLKTGESAEGTSVPDEDASEEDKKDFSPKKTKITLVRIEKAILPEINEKYYRMLGVKDENELTHNVTHLLNTKADAHVREQERGQVVEFLLHQNPFDLPHSFVVNETRFRMNQLAADPQFKAYWTQLPQEEQQQSLRLMMEHASKAVRLFYLCNHIVKEAHITITPEDLPKPSNTPLEALIIPPSEQFSHQDRVVREAEAFSRLTLEKAQDYLIAQAKTHQAETSGK